MAIELTKEAIIANVKVTTWVDVDLASEDYNKAVNAVNVDLSNPSNRCVFMYQLFRKVEQPGHATLGFVDTTAEWIIALIQGSMNIELVRIYEAAENPNDAPQIPITGVYDCETANAMTLFATVVRGNAIGDVAYWPLGESEFIYLMSNSTVLGDRIQQEAEKYQGGIESLKGDFEPSLGIHSFGKGQYKEAPVPSTCQGQGLVVERDKEKIVSEWGEAKDWVWPAVLGTISGVLLIGMGYIAFKKS